MRSRRALATLGFLGGLLLGDRVIAEDGVPPSLSCDAIDCASVLAGAVRFERAGNAAYFAGRDAEGEVIGWVALSTDVVDVPAYSGKPLVTLIGLRADGTIARARVLHHSEPILLVGIPEAALHRFVEAYAGKRADARIVVGRTSDLRATSLDVISGATVTVLAQNRTILDTARAVGAAVGVIDAPAPRPGRFVTDVPDLTWEELLDEEVFGRLVVSEAEMGVEGSRASFADLWFTLADAPHVGRPLLGADTYRYLMGQLAPGQHLFVVLGNGTSSFKGSAFVRGGIFDRVRVMQGLNETTFRDVDYQPLGALAVRGAPSFREGAVFITRGGRVDPGEPFDLVFLGSRYDHRGGFSREFREFRATLRLPRSVYVVEGPAREAADAVWRQAWANRRLDVVALSVLLGCIVAVFVARRWTAASRARIKRLHLAVMILSAAIVGLHMRAQPSVTQIFTFVDSVLHGWRNELFLSEPLIFVLWIFIAVVSLVWGRGVFCGWVCPYGVMTELANKLARLLRLPSFELPDRVHRPLRYLRYAVLAALVGVALFDTVLAEKLAEVEPFKSTFLVPFWTRHWGFGAWWLVLFALSLVMWRPFCRYLCPLGAGLALLNSFRLAGPYRRAFCRSCTICTKTCEPRAIDAHGHIDAQDCLSCMECEANYNTDTVCPPLIGIDRLRRKPVRSAHDDERLRELFEDAARRREPRAKEHRP